MPRNSPVRPPIVNRKNERQRVQHRRLAGTIEPLYIVASQLKTLIADGIETLNVSALKTTLASGDSP